ncbi:MAG: hypothetical protein ACTHNU_17020 [Gaiellales bacterium]
MTDAVGQIADAVLYEGHVLWPYRRSALKNQQRWTFGGVYPRAYAAHSGDRSRVGFECLLEGGGEVELEVRFLHVVHRQVFVDGDPVDELEQAGERYLTWDEARERRVGPEPFAIAAGEHVEPPFVRSWQPLEGDVRIRRERLGTRLERVSVAIENTSGFAGLHREQAIRRTLASAHAVVHARDGRLASVIDPPAELAEAAAGCRSEGLWPVLVGEPGDFSTVLASPIILPDHPQVAPESQGDFFDGAEIDQLLVLNIMGLTDAERSEMRASDPRARELLERTEAMSAGDLMRLHGTLRDVRALRKP